LALVEECVIQWSRTFYF